ncbi:hypothetical protein [Clostridium cylindrosporum]|uniref:Uncharacterized protein n=1 Tax=Clostridium cylindrosporum DSM 605 TaxID=1121307 RepID=A0A0J8DAJ1_CLOCY|nr:hypothetical protein [Clostridium cylindrosporum]KMT21323.1 hypothetical protein CLCY_2c00830 [Clostridium cylindrosporum DSM 605]
MKKVFRYLLDLNYANTLGLVSLSLLTILLHEVMSFGNYITAFLVAVMTILALLSPILRFKSIMFGRSRILFLTPKPYSSIINGYLLSELVVFITYYIGITICLFSLNGQVHSLNYFFNLGDNNANFLLCSFYTFINIFDIWFSFIAVGMISVILCRKYTSKKIRFLSMRIFICFVVIQFINIVAIELVGIIMLKVITRIIISLYIIYLSYRKIKTVDIY